jgi:predicted DNA-binding transcriptional regulator YafY
LQRAKSKSERRANSATARFSRPPLERMLRIHQQLKDERYPNCRTLAEELEVVQKTIQRDLDFMRDRLNLPIEYDRQHSGFHYTEPVTSFPSIEVSEGEIVALFVAQKALAQYAGTPFEQTLRAAFQKITSGLEDRVMFGWEDLDSSISFRGIGRSVADLDVFQAVSKAVLSSEEISFDYHKLRSPDYERRRVQPYHLGSVENQWYLFAFDLDRRQIRTFVLSRMRAVKHDGTKFQRPDNFSIERHLRGSFGVFSATGEFAVRIRFDQFAGMLIREREWHPSQKVKVLPDGGCELALELASLEEVERWILSWSDHAQVLDPPELVQSVRHRMEAALQHYL